MKKQPRILVLRGGAIGDFILTLPALQALRVRWPGAYLEVLGYPHVARLVVSGGLVDHVESLDGAGVARYFVPDAQLGPDQTDYIRSFDLIITYLYDPDAVVRTNLLKAGAPQVIYGNPLVHEGHATDRLLEPLTELAIFESEGSPALVLGGSDRQKGREWLTARALRRVTAIHPGSGSPSKNWPVEQFICLAERLMKEADASPAFIIGEADEKVADELVRSAPHFPLISGLSLLELGGVLSACERYVGNDSGITHLAAALGLPVVALFGPTDPDRWGPRGPRVTVLRAPDNDLAELSLDQVFAAVAEKRTRL